MMCTPARAVGVHTISSSDHTAQPGVQTTRNRQAADLFPINRVAQSVVMTRDAAYFDLWYQNMADSSAADEIVRRVLGLPARLQSTSLLGWAALDDVVAALDVADGQLLLDLACGRGGYGLEIAWRSGVRVVGVDFSAVAIGQARLRAQALGLADRADFRVGELIRTGLAEESVDAVLVVDAIQFAEPLPQALREIRRVLAPGGRLVITCWEVDSTDERLPEALRRLDFAEQLPHAGFTEQG